MGNPAFEEKIARWLADDFRRHERILRGMSGVYYNRLPRSFRPLTLAHGASRTALASSGPGVAYFYGSIPGWTAFIASAAIFAGHSVVAFLDRMSRQGTAESSAGQSEIFVRLGDLLKHTPGKAAARDRDEAIKACLGILENCCRQVTKTKKGDISVSLALYKGSSTTRMHLRHRNPGNDRPVGRDFDATDKMGHRVCMAGNDPRVVHDLRWFGGDAMVSPTQSSVNYRSLLIVPIGVKASDSQGARGFVSIDSTQPFAFYGNRSNVIMVTCEPVFSHLNALI